MKRLTTRQAAAILGVNASRIRQLVLSGELPAEKFGRDLVILHSNLKKVKLRPLGRPPKKSPKRTPLPKREPLKDTSDGVRESIRALLDSDFLTGKR